MILGVTVGLVGLLLRAEYRARTSSIRVLKPLASAGFVAHALACGALDSRYGLLIVTGLIASWVGDVCLLSDRKRWFVCGLLAFLVAHLAYITAFWGQGTSGFAFIGAALTFGPLTWWIRKRLRPHVPSQLRAPVELYMIVINLMVVVAIAAWHAGSSWMVVVGAIAFYASDVLVARDKFVAPGWGTRVWLLALYYMAQLLLGSTCL